jgi:hypothetical protein
MLDLPGRAHESATLIPVAKPAGVRGQVQTDDEHRDPEAPVLTPAAVKSWASSLGLHALLLLIFAFWVITSAGKDTRTFDTRLGGEAGGSPGNGDGGPLVGLDGLDEPLTMAPAPPTKSEASLSSLAISEIALDVDAAPKADAKARGPRNGVELPNPGGRGGNGSGFGLAKFGNGTENIGGIGVKVGDPQFTLIWDTLADIDIHVIEPGGSEIFWEHVHGDKGGELDVDDIDGFGPENVYWVQGQGPPGEYKWYVHYYGGLGGRNVPTHWQVRVKHLGKITVYKGILYNIGAKSKPHVLTVGGKENMTPPDESEGSK